MIFNTNVAINDTHYNPCHFHFCTTLVRRKCYFIFTKLQSSEVFREIPTLSPRLSPAKLKDKHAVFCIVNNFYYYLIFILLLLWATLEQKPVKRVAYVKFQLIYTFAPVYLIFFDITNFNVYISKIHANWKKKTAWREYSGQRVRSWSVFYWRGFKSHAYLSFFFHSSCDIKKIITFYPIVNLTTSNFLFYFPQIS